MNVGKQEETRSRCFDYGDNFTESIKVSLAQRWVSGLILIKANEWSSEFDFSGTRLSRSGGKTSTRSPQVFAARLFPRLDIYSKFERGIQPGYLDWQPGQEIAKLTKLWTIRRRFVLSYFLMITSISRFRSEPSKINVIIKNKKKIILVLC